MQSDHKINARIEAIIFEPKDFGSSMEDTIYVLYAKTANFTDINDFWNKAKVSYPYLDVSEDELSKPLSETEFVRITQERSYGLMSPLPICILEHRGWVSGILLTDQWYTTVMLAELDGQYVAFSWDTTA